ncbi:MAG: hypothetical protein ACI8RD_004508, partial [Bacillariaceae sp.]
VDLIVATGRRENPSPLAIIHPKRETSVKILPFIMILVDIMTAAMMITNYGQMILMRIVVMVV